jgi:predicted porin
LEKLAMKKSLIALAVLAASGASFAQSTVTLFGGADINYRSVTSGTNKFTGMAQDGIYSSRFGVMGTEDLGGGLKAGFHFEGGMNPDTGTPAGFNFARKSTLGVMGNFGEVRMGRDYTPLFTVHGVADPFGTNGVGSAGNMMFSTVAAVGTAIGAQAAANAAGTFVTANRGNIATTAPSAVSAAVVPASLTYADPGAVRYNNSVTYYTPTISGFSASAMYTFGVENTNTQKKAGTGTSLRLGYAAGPLTVAVANQVTKGGNAGALNTAASATLQPAGASCSSPSTTTAGISAATQVCNAAATTGTAATEDQKWTTNFLAASYNLGVARLSAGVKNEKLSGGANAKFNSNILGVAAPMGALTLKATYITKKVDSNKAGTQTAVGGVYDLSKRTSLYGTYATLKNEAGFGNVVGSAVASTSGATSKGFEFGVKHNF